MLTGWGLKSWFKINYILQIFKKSKVMQISLWWIKYPNFKQRQDQYRWLFSLASCSNMAPHSVGPAWFLVTLPTDVSWSSIPKAWAVKQPEKFQYRSLDTWATQVLNNFVFISHHPFRLYSMRVICCCPGKQVPAGLWSFCSVLGSRQH